jgi:dTDP-4-amino-4,6-dideoxygalactose transaminase
MDVLQKIATKYNLIIIEDSAQALGSKFKGKFAGTFGKAGTFSFYPAKVLGCFGDGGAVVTNDDEIARQLSLLRDHGRNKDGEVVAWGTNCRLDNIQAAILNVKLKKFDQDITRRREIASIYNRSLNGIGDLVLPPSPDSDENHFDVYQNYELESGKRNELKEYLEKKGIKTLVQWGGKAVHQCRGVGFDHIKLPVTDYMTSRFLMLPLHTALSDDDVTYVCDCVKQFYQENL